MANFITPTFIVIVLVAITVSTTSTEKEPSRESKQMFYDPYFPYSNTPPHPYPVHQPYFDRAEFPVMDPMEESFESLETVCGSLIGILVGGIPTYECPVCPTAPVIPDTATLCVTATECPDAKNFSQCARGSIAKSGSIKFKFEPKSPGNALLSIVSPLPESKIKVTCSPVPWYISVSTQSGRLESGVAKEESGFAFIGAISGIPLPNPEEVYCTWETVV